MEMRDRTEPTATRGTRGAMQAGLVTLGICAVAVLGWLAVTASGARPGTGYAGSGGPGVAGIAAPRAEAAERLRVEVLATAPHDPTAYTQGLLWHEGALFESTGLYGRSTLRKVDRATGHVLQQTQLEPIYFGEGLARVGDRLIQITWREGVAHVYQLQTFERVEQHRYDGEGWGLCSDGERLIMTDGSSSLTLRDPRSFAVLGTVPVTLDGQPLDRLNELECVQDRVYANVYLTDLIVRIDPRSGRVEAVIDASNLLSPEERRGTDVLNGIAYDPEQDVFLITGKLWPRLFEVRFVPAGS